MKAFTDISQSKKLAEILPLESADMCWRYNHNIHTYDDIPKILVVNNWDDDYNKDIPCWSLTALLGVLPYPSLHKTFAGWRCDSYDKEGKTCKLGENTDNPVDACYEMIVKLHELKML